MALEFSGVPAYEYRSFHLDTARHFFDADFLMRQIKLASQFHFNYFHLHLEDDQGWRLESKVYPELQDIGSVRMGDNFGRHRSNEKQGGYYPQEDIRDLVSYAASKGIEIVPEIDLPGHASAILAAYPGLGCSGKPVEVATRGGIFEDILCAGNDTVFEFIDRLMDEVCELFPGKYIHIGGDEAPKARWKRCPRCRERMNSEGLSNYRELEGYFLNRVAAHLIDKGRTPIAWNEATYGGNLDPRIVVQVWTEDREDGIAKHVAHGGRIIYSPFEYTYCDYPYGSLPVSKMYSIDLKPAGIDSSSIIGTECLCWTEHIREERALEKAIWPRYCAIAEAAWMGDSREPYEVFKDALIGKLDLFNRCHVAVTEAPGWDPSPAEAARQIESFHRHFDDAVNEHYDQSKD